MAQSRCALRKVVCSEDFFHSYALQQRKRWLILADAAHTDAPRVNPKRKQGNHMTTKLETKTENGMVLVKIKGGLGSWGRPVVDDQGNFYRSVRVAGDAVNVSPRTVSNSIEAGTILKGRLFAYANEAEVKKNVAVEENGHKLSNGNGHGRAASTPAAQTVAQTVVYNQPFLGVRWPDGGVTVKLLNSTWRMDRKSIDELPEEILNACRWM